MPNVSYPYQFIPENDAQVVEFVRPTTCPQCNSPASQQGSGDGATYRCSNSECRVKEFCLAANGDDLVTKVLSSYGYTLTLETPLPFVDSETLSRAVKAIEPAPNCPICAAPSRRLSPTRFICETRQVRPEKCYIDTFVYQNGCFTVEGNLLPPSSFVLYLPLFACRQCAPQRGGVMSSGRRVADGSILRRCGCCARQDTLSSSAKDILDRLQDQGHGCSQCGSFLALVDNPGQSDMYFCVVPDCPRRGQLVSFKVYAKGDEANMRRLKLGWEYEACKIKRGGFASLASVLVQGSDGSVSGDELEFKTGGPMTAGDALETLYLFQDKCAPQVDKSCGIHLHVSVNRPFKSSEPASDAAKFEQRVTNSLFSLASMFEARLFSLMPESRQNNQYCKKISSLFKKGSGAAAKQLLRDKMGTVHDNKHSNDKRYCWVNFVEMWRRGGIRTVEFRLLGNTNKTAFIVSWFRTCLALVYGAVILNTEENADSLTEAVETINEALGTLEKAANESSMSKSEEKDFLEREGQHVLALEKAINAVLKREG